MSTSTDELPPAAKEAEPDAGEIAKEVSKAALRVALSLQELC